MDICNNTLFVKIRGTSCKAGLQTTAYFSVTTTLALADRFFKTHFNTIDQCLAAAHPTHQLPLPPAPHSQTHKLKQESIPK